MSKQICSRAERVADWLLSVAILVGLQASPHATIGFGGHLYSFPPPHFWSVYEAFLFPILWGTEIRVDL